MYRINRLEVDSAERKGSSIFARLGLFGRLLVGLGLSLVGFFILSVLGWKRFESSESALERIIWNEERSAIVQESELFEFDEVFCQKIQTSSEVEFAEIFLEDSLKIRVPQTAFLAC